MGLRPPYWPRVSKTTALQWPKCLAAVPSVQKALQSQIAKYVVMLRLQRFLACSRDRRQSADGTSHHQIFLQALRGVPAAA